MLDRFFLPALAALALAAIALAMVWPQGLGDRSPGPFGHVPVQQTPEMQARMKRETDASEQRLRQARDAVADLQSQAVAPGQ
jgi:Flp pilus assembly protein TadB